MYQYVPFDDIDRQKWESTMHYSPNGNIFGQYWYLKAVFREWGAIIEDDYETILPLPDNLDTIDASLVPELGPYSINHVGPQKFKDILAKARSAVNVSNYPINSHIAQDILGEYVTQASDFYTMHLIDPYDRIYSNYSPLAKQRLEDIDYDSIKITAGVKPETVIEHSNLDEGSNNALLRIMYNCLHQGVGWSSGIISKETGHFLALSFFVASHNSVQEIFAMPSPDPAYRYLLYDLIMKNTAGKPSRIASSVELPALIELGMENEAIALLSM